MYCSRSSLTTARKRRAKATYQQYSVAILSFQNWLKEHAPKLRVSDLRRKHLMDWAGECFPLARDGQEGYARDTVRGMMAAVQRAFNWAVERDDIPYSPIAKVRKPGKVQRDVCLLPGQWEKLLAEIKPGSFRDLIVALRFTGARPQEVRQIEARHLFLDQVPPFWTMEPEKAKGGLKARITPLVGPMVEICRRLAAKWPEGVIFRTRRGKPWNRFAVHSNLWRLEKKLGFRVCATTMRHTFNTHAQQHGATATSAAVVLGNSEKMAATQYQHLALFGDHMVETMQKATEGVIY